MVVLGWLQVLLRRLALLLFPQRGTAFFLTDCLRRVLPGDVAFEVVEQVVTCCLELVADHPQTKQPDAEGVFLILGNGFLCLG